MNYKTIGILGGMGPATSAEFYTILVKKYQENGSVQDTDFPKMIINSATLKGFDEKGIADFDLVKNQLCLRMPNIRESRSRFYSNSMQHSSLFLQRNARICKYPHYFNN
jgi:hypothetical protein